LKLSDSSSTTSTLLNPASPSISRAFARPHIIPKPAPALRHAVHERHAVQEGAHFMAEVGAEACAGPNVHHDKHARRVRLEKCASGPHGATRVRQIVDRVKRQDDIELLGQVRSVDG
jgi:hypothetical protein